MDREEPASTPQQPTMNPSFMDSVESLIPPPNVPPPENYQMPARPFWWPIPTRVKAVPVPEGCPSLETMEFIPPPNVPKPENFRIPARSTLPVMRGPVDDKRGNELRKELTHMYCKKVWDVFYYSLYKVEAMRDLEMLSDIIDDDDAIGITS